MLRASLLFTSAFVLMAQSPACLAVNGRILGSNAKPIPRALVTLILTDNSASQSLMELRSDAHGRFNLMAPIGSYDLTITAPGCLPHSQSLELKANSPMLPLEIHLEKGGHRIQGRLLPDLGQNLEGASLCFFSKANQGKRYRLPTEVKQGHFDITLATGDYEAFAIAKGQTGSQDFKVRGPLPNAFVQLRAEPTAAEPETLAWITQNALPLKGVEAGHGFADLQPFKAIVGDATVVGLGEATHGSREFFQLKHRMLEFLATEMGFTVFAIEANLPEAFAVNDFVLTGQGDPAKALAGLYFWTWNTEEVLDMIRWMRTYNEDPAHRKKLRFYCVDMQTETMAYAQAKAWLDTADPIEAAKLQEIKQAMAKLPGRYSGKTTKETFQAWASSAKEVEALITRLETQELTGADFDRQRQNLRVLAQFATMNADARGVTGVRDASMAANLRWIQAREKGAKIVLWAHNGHIAIRPANGTGVAAMGWHLRQALGKAYVPIGFAFREGGFQAMNGDPQNRGLKVFEVKPQAMGTLDAALAATKLPFLALDLRNRPKQGQVKHWLESPQGTWRIGAGFTPGQELNYLSKEPITDSYDALLFVNHTTSANPVGGRHQVPVHATQAKAAMNLGFEEGLSGWSNPKDFGYVASVVDQGAKEGSHCLQVVYQGEPNPKAWWTAMQAVDAEPYRGKKICLKAWIRTNALPAFKAMCWVRVDAKSGRNFFDGMVERPVTSKEWTEVALEGPVAEDAVSLNFGCMVRGPGTAWFDGIRVELMP